MLTEIASTCANEFESSWSVCWNPVDAGILACCGSDKTISIYRASHLSSDDGTASNAELSLICRLDGQHNRTLRCMQFSCNGLLACASFDATVSIYRPCYNEGPAAGLKATKTIGGYEFMCTLDGHENEVKSVAWSPSGTMLATCGRDKSVWIWALDPESDEFECVAVLQEHTQDVKMVAWHPVHDNLLISCSYDDSIKVWLEDASDEDWYCAQTLNNFHSSTVWAVDFTSDGSKLVSVGDDMAMNIYDVQFSGSSSVKVQQQPQTGKLENVHMKPIYSVSVMKSSQSFIIATGSADNRIAITRIDNDANGQLLTHTEHQENAHSNGDVNCVAWHPQRANFLASVGDDGQVKLWIYSDTASK